jgi:hypothetical protein
LRKEFFQLVLENLFNEEYGMFVLNAETRNYWFSNTTFDSPNEFRLLGKLLGIALYNGVNLNLNFPLVVYKKLLKDKSRKAEPQITVQSRLRDLARDAFFFVPFGDLGLLLPLIQSSTQTRNSPPCFDAHVLFVLDQRTRFKWGVYL